MPVRNVHARSFIRSATELGVLLDGLAGPGDRLWPRDRWPAMRLDAPLGVGAAGGHGPIRYTITAYEPGRQVRFAFTAPRGFTGHHEFTVIDGPGQQATLRHTLVLRPRGWARLSWPLVFRPLHDALIEDALDLAELALTGTVHRRATWSRYVRTLRALFRRGS